ncbi:MAG TPA: PQQ-dependent sugar dehydrogenase [Candidatus Limnocylindrales bacterium]|nr:PQQ-dependent sugar dehydrogenase [Candidatus Limnocylindrales bacterium]
MIGSTPRSVRRLALAAVSTLVVACGSITATDAPSATSVAPASPAPSAGASTSASPVTPTPGRADPAGVALAVAVVVDGLTSPVDVASVSDGSGRLFVVEQPGQIRLVQDGRLVTRSFLDIRDRVASGGERGLLGLALHPDFPADPRLFVDYTDLDGNTVVSEFHLDPADHGVADRDSERILIRIDQPFPNHNGGAVAFGPDGMLYVSTGDGGSGGDPQGNGQRLDTLLAKILRIDVDGQPVDADPYRIPDDNPFVNVADAMPEIWLTGLRNPWRMRFDGQTGDLWIGDVGQGAWEEIDVAPAATGGLDFGWNVMEGAHCYQPSDGCDETGLTPPMAEYGHDQGCAVIGGVVVRDPDQPLLDGLYVFSDSCSGTFWVLDAAAQRPQTPVRVWSGGRSISSIGLDEDGTILATDLGSGELLAITGVPR